jgi:voltage-gated potassium channel
MPKILRDHIIICGYGLVGERIADILLKHKFKIIVIENDIKRAELVKKEGMKVIIGDATTSKVLKEAGIEYAKGIAVVMDNDPKNIFCIITAKNLNKNIIIASRVNDDLLKERFKDAGAKFIASPNKSTSDEIFKDIMSTK